MTATVTNSTQVVSPQQPKISVENPYRALLAQSPHNDARSLYSAHRTARSTAQRALVLDPVVPFKTDPVLSAILQHDPPDFSIDTRHNLTVWARPSPEVYELVALVQKKLREAVGGDDQGIWFPPPDAQHMTVFEIASGLTAPALRPVIDALRPHAAALTSPYLACAPSSASAAKTAPALDTPTLNVDLSGIALSFLPAASNAGEGTRAPSILDLRAAMWDTAARAGVLAAPRYALPSAHVTVGRFVSHKGGEGPGMERKAWVRLLDEINGELEGWKGVWRVEKMVLRGEVSWYGGGVDVTADGKA
ncbi:hypothetical protein EIP86_009528 [Pleurotus ostreatoroseus]|nr:hypothetical protein EIP86_009528 [Pleurotus ostreatoroseus]